MTPAERLSEATTNLKAAAKRWSDSEDPPTRHKAFLTLLEAANTYALRRAEFQTWLRALPPPKEVCPPRGAT